MEVGQLDKLSVLDIRHGTLIKVRQWAVALLDKSVLLEGDVSELQKTIESQRDDIKQLKAQVEALSAPIPMILFCPICRARHIDRGRFAAQPHKSHSCQGCGFTWSPSHRHTVGVDFLPGYKDETPTITGLIGSPMYVKA